MIEVKKEGILLNKTELEFENEGVLNPAVMQEGDTVHVFLPGGAKKGIIPLSVIANSTVRLRSEKEAIDLSLLLNTNTNRTVLKMPAL